MAGIIILSLHKWRPQGL